MIRGVCAIIEKTQKNFTPVFLLSDPAYQKNLFERNRF